MTTIDPKIEEEIFEYIDEHIEELLKPNYVITPNPGIAEYDLATIFSTIKPTKIRDYLVSLKKKGKLKITEIRPVKGEDDLILYRPAKNR